MKKNILQIYKEFKDTLALWHSTSYSIFTYTTIHFHSIVLHIYYYSVTY